MMKKSILFVLLFVSYVSAFAQNPVNCSRVSMGESSKQKNNDLVRLSNNPLMNDYDVKFYGLDLAADNTSAYVEGSVTINSRVVSESLSQFVIELINSMTVDSIFVDNAKHDFSHANDEISISLNTTLNKGDLFEVKIYYHGEPTAEDTAFAGIYNDKSQTWGNQITWTLSEPFGARVWMPCKQVLEDKADSVYVFITVPDHLAAGANGTLTNVVTLPDNLKRYEWKSNYPIAYYLISMTIGSYVIYETYAEPAGTTPILIQNFIYDNPDCLPYFKDDLDELDELIELFSGFYGLYPFHNEKYGHCMAPFGGGMEHQTMTTQGSFSLTLDAHEMAHQWFGDNATCKSWQDIWVNEGFARYSEYLAMENLRSEAEANDWLKNEYLDIMELSGGSVYIPEAEVDDYRIFDFRLTYEKGGALVHMIRNIIDDDVVFFDALKSFQQQYTDSTASGLDMKTVLEKASGYDFTNFFDEWYFGEGYPIYNVTWNYYSDTLFIEQKQTTSTISTTLFHTPLEYKISFANRDSVIRVSQSSNEQVFKIRVPEEVISIEADPDQWLLKKVASLTKDTYQPDPDNNNPDPDENPTEVTGLTKGKEGDFKISPNPSIDFVNIENINAVSLQLVLTDLQGKVLMTMNVGSQSNIQLDLTPFEPGLFILTMKTDHEAFNYRILKQ